MNWIKEALEAARPSTFAVEAIACDETRLIWGYKNPLGRIHIGLAPDLDGAMLSASVYGFRLNSKHLDTAR